MGIIKDIKDIADIINSLKWVHWKSIFLAILTACQYIVRTTTSLTSRVHKIIHQLIRGIKTIVRPPHSPRALKRLALDCKERRHRLGVSQAYMGRILGTLPGLHILAQDTISHLENGNMTIKRMRKLMPQYVKALVMEESRQERPDAPLEDPDAPIVRKRAWRRRTIIEASAKQKLKEKFKENPSPSNEEITRLATEINLNYMVVRTWFANQRQHRKRMCNR
ncbi:POU domain, class 3, transcription factor 3-like [Drosophila albomicans]|uniref:POU domain, class 3, transcription factor 3-like n=1 Tax=Drosophila albomicans TaxID=7291 RepID=A0A6P8WKJ9_DROAB|nr:POU domain, class 3, transcription factor 3-like [Drosophila albomicans]